MQLKTPSCQPSSTTPTAPRSTSNSPPPMSCTWPVDSCCHRLIGLTCLLLRGHIRSSLLLTRWWAWWRGSFRSVTLPFKSSSVIYAVHVVLNSHFPCVFCYFLFFHTSLIAYINFLFLFFQFLWSTCSAVTCHASQQSVLNIAGLLCFSCHQVFAEVRLKL